jgi:transposase-like protein
MKDIKCPKCDSSNVKGVITHRGSWEKEKHLLFFCLSCNKTFRK